MFKIISHLRTSFIPIKVCSKNLTPSRTFYLHQKYNCRILSDLRVARIFPAHNNQWRLLSNNEPKQKVPTSDGEAVHSKQLSQRARFKQAVRDYGATLIVFHIAISLTSLGICYVTVSNGVDVLALLTRLGFSDTLISNKVAVGGGTFVMAYAVHKLIVPVRMGITLTAVPFIVRYLRKKNWIKPPKIKQ